MTRKDLEAALAECVGHTPGPWIDDGGDILSSGGITLATVWSADNIPEYTQNRNLILRAPFIAAAVRELRETVKAKDAQIEGLIKDIVESGQEDAVKIQTIRELRETVKAKDEEIARLKLSWDSAEAQIDDVDDELREVVKENAALRKKLHEAGVNPSLDQALNEGDGSYKP